MLLETKNSAVKHALLFNSTDVLKLPSIFKAFPVMETQLIESGLSLLLSNLQ